MDSDEQRAAEMNISDIQQTCLACPSQWEGHLADGCPIYIRYRWGELSVRVGPTGGTIDDALDSAPVFERQIGDHLDGSIELDEVCRLTGLIAPKSDNQGN
jgi:hypothetical protein